MNAIFNAVSMEEFKRISNVEVAHTAWNILQTVHDGTKAVKINKLQQLTSKFESIRMSDDESSDEFYAKLNDIVNSTYNLGEIYDQPNSKWNAKLAHSDTIDIPSLDDLQILFLENGDSSDYLI